MTPRDYRYIHGGLDDDEMEILLADGLGKLVIDQHTPLVSWPDAGEPPWAAEEEPVE